jgi:transposase InsO family protein
LKYVVVVVEYFSKWIEAKPLTTITSTTVQKFFWQNIVCRFGVPKAITVDNGTQFDTKTFKEFCDHIGTKIHFASVRHPESNGLVERANGIIMTRIMKLIFNQPRGKWPEELIKVVWSHNTTMSRSTGFTPFKLLFGDIAITIGVHSGRPARPGPSPKRPVLFEFRAGPARLNFGPCRAGPWA